MTDEDAASSCSSEELSTSVAPCSPEDAYIAHLRPMQFEAAALTGNSVSGGGCCHYFRNMLSKTENGDCRDKQRSQRLAKEVIYLQEGLPLALQSSIFVRVDESRLDVFKALLIGPEDTPYADGCFLFDIYCPPDYPQRAPQVQFLTTGGGRVRFNPNLYSNGLVCLSLLNTWNGPGWDANTSTLLQLLVSIQGLVLVKDPYFNEPGYETRKGTPAGECASELYNEEQRLHTLTTAILPVLRKPPAPFEEIIKFHFSYKKDAIQVRMQQWLAMCPLGTQRDLVGMQVESIDTELLHLAMAGVTLESM